MRSSAARAHRRILSTLGPRPHRTCVGLLPPRPLCTKLPRRVLLGNSVSGKRGSRKPAFIRPHTYTMPGRRQAGLISELPRRVLLGNSGGMKRAGAVRPRPWLLALLCYSLRTFPDLYYLVRYEPVSLPVNGFRRFFVWGFGKAEDLATLLVVPVPVILNPVFVLDFKILLVGLGHRLCGQPFNPLVVVHKEWHSTYSPFSAFPQRVMLTLVYTRMMP